MIDLTPVWISLKTAITATIITFFLGIFSAWWMLGCKSKFKPVIESILTAPLVLPPTVVGFILLFLFGKNGFIGRLLANLFDFTIIFSWYATVIASTVVAFPLMYKTALGAFKQIDTNLLDCARTLGAREWVIFWRIILPLAKNGLIAGILLSFARALGEFGATLMLAGSIPNKTETIPIAIFFASESGEMDEAMGLVIIMLVISLGVITVVNYTTEGKGFDKLKRHHQLNGYNLQFWLKKPLLTSKNRNYPLIQAKIELVVQIQKQLSEFCLDVNFKTDQTPLGLLGASGAGKSMILRCIAGLESPDRGLIILNGKVLFDSSQKINLPPRERNCGFLFQNYALFPHLTVAENIAFGMLPKQSYQEMKAEIERQLMTVELSGMGHYYPKQLSGGQQQRVALARAKASKPEILLLDEPFSALDTYLRDKQEKLLRNSLIHYQGATLFITHNLEEAYRVCPYLLIIDQGSAIASGRKQDIFECPPNFRSAQLTGCKNFSSVEIIAHNKIKALDWNCTLELIEPVSKSCKYVGIRAHHLLFPNINQEHQINTFPCWLATISETQHRVTLYLKLNQPTNHQEDYHLQAEVLKDKWMELKDNPFPWKIQILPPKIMLFEN
ncbi:molybdate ABC transporter permease subunit [Cyanobacterium aponinum FACHB-4101]|uniref:molybdate ABC transporter permease subunit n=1 Tax=Cyanobacterium aponinum TaxID=379064 RepID=UPI001680CC0A|nr:molybdate ABC transporter permease subunit [Cyanobacterium aponinum]MBD2392718.1 molybdate ABC transporter permease subunit [Cyanobacterium aponinum FACHB-4101]